MRRSTARGVEASVATAALAMLIVLASGPDVGADAEIAPDRGGETVATDRLTVTPASEACTAPSLSAPAYNIAPRDMLDWTPTESRGAYTFQGFRPPEPATRETYDSPLGALAGAPGSTLGANEGRLRKELRAAASREHPNALASLCKAARSFTRGERDFGNAFADLAVTGKAAFADFARRSPTEASLRGRADCAGVSLDSMGVALDRAYQVAAALRGPHLSPARQGLGWIAVSGEDDQPYRPVNVPSTEFPQLDLDVTAHGLTVATRYSIAHARPPAFERPEAPLVDGGPERQVPADPAPALAPDAEVILYIHGLDARLEESLDLTNALHRLAGPNWTVVAMDLPSSGYADNIDDERIAPLSAVACHSTPVLDYLEDFVVAFVDALDSKLLGRLKPRIRAIAGGSLGGSLTLRLGRRADTPWVRSVVPWSPASMWPSMIAQEDCFQCGCDTGWAVGRNEAVMQSLYWAGMVDTSAANITLNAYGQGSHNARFLPASETPELRRELFYGSFDWDGGNVIGIFSPDNHVPRASCWFSSGWPCKDAAIAAARLDRQETYDARFRAWHWRLAGEQLAFSHQQRAPGMGEPLYRYDRKPTLLLSAEGDACAALGATTRSVAARMVDTPGRYRFLNGVGHSLDNERPAWVAAEIADFLAPR